VKTSITFLLILFLTSCSSKSIRGPSSVESLNCMDSLLSFEEVREPSLSNTADFNSKSIMNESEYDEIFAMYKSEVEKEEAAKLIYAIEKQFPEETIESRKSRFWDLLTCDT